MDPYQPWDSVAFYCQFVPKIKHFCFWGKILEFPKKENLRETERWGRRAGEKLGREREGLSGEK